MTKIWQCLSKHLPSFGVKMLGYSLKKQSAMASCQRLVSPTNKEKCSPQCWKAPKTSSSPLSPKNNGRIRFRRTNIYGALKYWFVDENNKAACRYLLVDAYNNESTIHYYLKNGFKPLYKTELNEKLSFGISEESDLRSRIMFFDLKLIL